VSAIVSVRDKRILTVAEVVGLLGEQTTKDARAAGWLRPVATKENNRRDRPIFAAADLRAVEDRILSGEYPGQEKGGAA
jgi:hypothetical protein